MSCCLILNAVQLAFLADSPCQCGYLVKLVTIVYAALGSTQTTMGYNKQRISIRCGFIWLMPLS